jgi:hypothetical protein
VTPEHDVDAPLVRRRDHDVSDRRSMVVDESRSRREPLRVERRRALAASLLPCGEDELDTGVGPVLDEDETHRLEHRRDGRLVVRAEDRAPAVAHDAVLDHRDDRPGRLHRVEVRAEEDRFPVSVAGRLEADIDVPRVGADRPAGVVDHGVESEILELTHDSP